MSVIQGCSGDPSGTVETIYEYKVPKSEIHAYFRGDGGHAYLKIESAEPKFWMIFDEFANRRQRNSGREVVSAINEGTSSNIDQISTSFGTVYCKKADAYACGIQLKDNNRIWSVVFDRSDIENVGKINAAARQKIQFYAGLRTWRPVL